MFRRQKLTMFFVAIMYFVLAAYLFIQPEASLSIISNVIGMALLFSSVLLIWNAYFLPPVLEVRKAFMLEAFLVLLISLLIFIMNPKIFTTSLAYLMIFWFLISSVIHIQFSLFLYNFTLRFFIIILNAFVIVLSFYLFTRPDLAQQFLAYALSLLFVSLGINKLLIGMGEY